MDDVSVAREERRQRMIGAIHPAERREISRGQ
jgi:hypothetical protein